MGIKDVFKKVAGKVAKKTKKVVNKAVVPNLVQAKKILKSDALKNNIDGADNILEGKAAILTLKEEDFLKFANREKDNALDAVDKISKLLAESLLTTTTTDKLNGFKDVYNSSKEYLEKFRDTLFVEINNAKEIRSSAIGTYTLDDFFGGEKVDFENYSEACIRGSDDDKDVQKRRKAFVKALKTHVNNIDKNLKVVKKILGKEGPLQSGMQDILDEMGPNEIVDTGKQTLEQNYGDVGFQLNQVVSDVEARRKKCRDAVAALTASVVVAMAVSAPAGPFAMLFVGASVGVKVAPFLILLSILGIINDSKFQKKAFIKKYKNDCNKIKQSVTQMFKSMRNIRSLILDASNDGDDRESVKPDQKTIQKFQEDFHKIWSNYSESENRKYGYFEEQEKYARMISEIDADLRRTNEVKRVLEGLSNNVEYQNLDKKVKKSIQEVFTPPKKSLVAVERTQLRDRIKTIIDAIVEGRLAVHDIIDEFDLKIDLLNTESETIINEMKEKQEAESGSGRKKAKTSSMGLFKDGFAKTCANIEVAV